MKQLAVLILIILHCSYGTLVAQDKQTFGKPILDESIEVLHAEALDYPTLARQARVQGIVVIHANLDASGRVVSTSAVSGSKALIQVCLSNSTKWQFKPNQPNEAVIIYDFRLEGVCMLPSCNRSFFSFRPPNVALITATPPAVETVSELKGDQ